MCFLFLYSFCGSYISATMISTEFVGTYIKKTHYDVCTENECIVYLIQTVDN